MEEDQVGTELFLYFDSSTARPVQYRPRELSYADCPNLSRIPLRRLEREFDMLYYAHWCS